MTEVTFNMPPPVPPAHVQTVDAKPITFADFVKNEQQKKIDTVVACIILEAGGEGQTGMEAVNEVIHNRAKAQNKSLVDVVTAPKQFSCFNEGVTSAIEKAKKHSKWKDALQILQSPLTNHTSGAVYYHTHAVSPKWGPKLIKQGYQTTTIGNHLFYHR